MMDTEDIDENMTVPHPSIHSTTTNSCNVDLYCTYANSDIYATTASHPPHQQQQQQQQQQLHHHHHQQHQLLHPTGVQASFASLPPAPPIPFQQQQQQQQQSELQLHQHQLVEQQPAAYLYQHNNHQFHHTSPNQHVVTSTSNQEHQFESQIYEQQTQLDPIYSQQQHTQMVHKHQQPNQHLHQQHHHQHNPHQAAVQTSNHTQHFQQHPHLHMQPQSQQQQQQQMVIQQPSLSNQINQHQQLDLQQQPQFSPSPNHQHQFQQHQHQQEQNENIPSPSSFDQKPFSAPLAVHHRMIDKLSQLGQQSIQNGKELKSLCHYQENFVLVGHERGSIYAMKEKTKKFKTSEQLACELKEREDKLRQMSNELRAKKEKLLTDFSDLFVEVSGIQSEVLFQLLPEWHLNQQLALNGTPIDNHNLDHIQQWCELITDIFWRTRNQLRAFYLFIKSVGCNTSIAFQKINQLGFAINRAIETHVLNTLVVEKQPPQVMKTNTRFSSTIRLLSGSKLNISLINPTIKVNILSEANARSIKRRHQELIAQSWAFVDLRQDSPQHSQQPTAGRQSAGMISPVSVSSSVSMSVSMSSSINQPSSSTVSTQPLQMDYSSAPSESVPSPPANHSAYAQESPISGPAGTLFGPQVAPKQEIFQQHLSSPHHQHHLQQQVNQQQQVMLAPDTQYNKNKILNMKIFEPSGEIFNSNALLEYNEITRQASGHFKNMQLKKIKRPEKKGTESVTDEKFILLFHSQFRIADLSNNDNGFGMQANSNSDLPWLNQGDMIFHLMAFSLPVVVIVHGNQEPHAWATVTWHNAFARPDDVLYHVPETVYWHELGKIFSDKFRTNAGKGLSQENIDYLGSKVCRTNIEDEKQLVTWSQFSKEPLPEKTFTFWEWFHSVLKLTREQLKNLWNADRIYGFIGKKGSVELLLGNSSHEPKQIGTFLLRYSETELGGITIAWVSSSAAQNSIKNENVQVYQRHSPTSPTSNVLMHIQPFGSKDLNTRSLADRIRDLENLVYLYPDIPKDEAFSAYYTPLNGAPTKADDYVQPMLIQTLVTNYVNNSVSNTME